MNQPAFLLVAIGTLAVTISLSQAWSQNSPRNPKSLEARTDAAHTKLKDLEHSLQSTNSKKACDADSQCEVLELGSRLCGGPSKYIIVSSANPKNYSQVKAKIAEYTKAEDELNRIDAPATCTPVPEMPNAICKEGQCAAAPSKKQEKI